jgi:DNA repair protein RadA/Sms
VHFGEVSLSGALNAIPLMTPRLKEAQKLGFRSAVLPAQGELDTASLKLELDRVAHVRDLADTAPSCD